MEQHTLQCCEHSACLYSLAFIYLPKPVLLKSLPSPAPMESIANASVQSVLSVDVDHIEANGLIDSFPPQKPSSLSNPADWFGWIDDIIMGVNEGAADEEAIDLADHLFSLTFGDEGIVPLDVLNSTFSVPSLSVLLVVGDSTKVLARTYFLLVWRRGTIDSSFGRRSSVVGDSTNILAQGPGWWSFCFSWPSNYVPPPLP